jgi:F-type H+-transporting ATPase subunit epsilon
MLNIVAPAGEVLRGEVNFLVVPGVEGELGILAHHAPMVAALRLGILRYVQEDKEKKMFVGGGFLEVDGEQATVLARVAENAESIDTARAQAAKERAERRLKDRTSETDILRAEMALKRALVRLSLAARK